MISNEVFANVMENLCQRLFMKLKQWFLINTPTSLERILFHVMYANYHVLVATGSVKKL